MDKFVARAKVVATAAVTWLVVIATAVPIVAEEVAKVAPAGVAEQVTAVALTIAGIAGAAIAIIRRVTPVLPAERGILPPGDA